ncbi:hypothetical protein SmJEL517_g01382 [Synchytrium microbalum]|uniref:Ankyrin n=1 Tax=Synchytrium microbalum TaxID=1806994 RepID=A0A507C6M1_9FUNG|nr:uncharacterized protein SmJEL517_g01382 [Synchytrium microbalum]TPX36687.1 hypothetical protein SmJEL517_g01382 [Synchytrium microbalum]
MDQKTISRSSSSSSTNSIQHDEWPDDSTELGKMIFSAINDGDRDKLAHILNDHPSSTLLLQLLLTTAYPNHDAFYAHDPDVIQDANELLGAPVSNLNAIQIACILGDEDIATDILEFVARITEEIEAKKILLEFVGRVWGAGNTVLHLASFLGMADLVKRLLELGANPNKKNDRNYRPVDCADDDVTRKPFTEIAELVVSVTPKIHEGRSSVTSISERPFKNSRTSADATNVEPTRLHAKSQSEDPRRRLSETRESTAKLKRSSSAEATPSLPTTSSSTTATSPNPIIIDTAALLASRQKLKRNVVFDPSTMILDICHHGDPVDNVALPTLRAAVGLNTPNKSIVDISTIFTPYNWLSPLHQACTHGHVEIVNLLLTELNSCVNITDKEGWTPLHCACAEGHVEILQLLARCQGRMGQEKQAGKNWFYPPDGPICLIPVNEDGETPDDVAFEAKSKEIRAILTDLKAQYPPKASSQSPLSEGQEEDQEEEDDDEEEEVFPAPKLALAPPPARSALKGGSQAAATIIILSPSIDTDKTPRPSVLSAAVNDITPRVSLVASAASSSSSFESDTSMNATPFESARSSQVTSPVKSNELQVQLASNTPSSKISSLLPSSVSKPSAATINGTISSSSSSPSSNISISTTAKVTANPTTPTTPTPTSTTATGLPPLHPSSPAGSLLATPPRTSVTSKIPKMSTSSPPSIRAHPPVTEAVSPTGGSIRRVGRRMSNQDLSIKVDLSNTMSSSMGQLSRTASEQQLSAGGRRRSKDITSPTSSKPPSDGNLRRRGKDVNASSTTSPVQDAIGRLKATLDDATKPGDSEGSRSTGAKGTIQEDKKEMGPIQRMGSVQASSRAQFKSVRSAGATR